MSHFEVPKTVLRPGRGRAGWGIAKIELPESWASVAEPLRALMAKVEREAHADGNVPPDLATVSARWAQVRDAIRATVRARIVAAQAAQALVPKR
jgi:hypothetical protein